MGYSFTRGSRVRHAVFGEGVVAYVRGGFPKVRVDFVGGPQKVNTDELVVAFPTRIELAVPQRAVADSLLGRLAALADRWKGELAGAAARPGWRCRLHYDDAEVELVFLVAASAENRTDLARLLGRTEDAVDLLWRWCDGAHFPDRARNEISRQVEAVRARLGDEARGSWREVPVEFRRLAASEAA